MIQFEESPDSEVRLGHWWSAGEWMDELYDLGREECKYTIGVPQWQADLSGAMSGLGGFKVYERGLFSFKDWFKLIQSSSSYGNVAITFGFFSV